MSIRGTVIHMDDHFVISGIVSMNPFMYALVCFNAEQVMSKFSKVDQKTLV